MEKVFQNLIFFLFLFSFFVSGANAVDTFAQSSDIDIIHPVRLDGAIAAGILCNISVYYPNNTALIDWDTMTDSGDYFNYTLNTTQTTLKGFYDYTVTCSTGILNQTESFEFLINLGGVEPTEYRTSSLTRTIWIFFGGGILFFITFLFIKNTPLKLTFLLLMMWLFLMGLNASYIALQDEIINTSLETFFSFFLTISYYLNYFIFLSIIILWVITFIVSIIERKKQRFDLKYG